MYRELNLKCWTPLGGSRIVHTIANDIEHIGNAIAEGDVHPSLFWPNLAKTKGMRLKHLLRLDAQRRAQEARDRYKREWVSRWLRDQEYLSYERGMSGD